MQNTYNKFTTFALLTMREVITTSPIHGPYVIGESEDENEIIS